MKLMLMAIFMFNFALATEDDDLIADIPAGTKIAFSMDTILKNRELCLKTGDDYRIKDQMHFVNGDIECNSPIFERSCLVLLDLEREYQSRPICRVTNITQTRHHIDINFTEDDCPVLRCRPLMFTGMFTGPDLGIKSLKYNIGEHIDFDIDGTSKKSPKSVLDKSYFNNDNESKINSNTDKVLQN